MGMLKNIAKKALVTAMLYAGKRVASKVAGKLLETAKNKVPPKAG
jgi:hypothetical protein